MLSTKAVSKPDSLRHCDGLVETLIQLRNGRREAGYSILALLQSFRRRDHTRDSNSNTEQTGSAVRPMVLHCSGGFAFVSISALVSGR